METVRCAIFRLKRKHSEVLMLQKNATSKNPYALEFPGGKVVDIWWQKYWYRFIPKKRGFQKKQIQREIKEETGLNILLSDIHYLGTRKYKNSATHKVTNVHNFFTILEKDLSISINNIGKEEDKHAQFFWFGFNAFRHYCRQEEGTVNGFVCKNSRFPMLWRSVFA